MIKQPILVEFQYFVDSVTLLFKGATVKDIGPLVKCALYLLEELPSTRDVVFDFFSLVFNGSVKSYMINIEKSHPDGSPDDEAVQEIHEALERNVLNGPPAWSPLISSWCLKVLGEICDNHNRRRQLDIRMASHLWLGSVAIRCLLGLAALCFENLNESEVDGCIGRLLNTFSLHSPHFDWVVARLGGCFPLKVISRILTIGLKRFNDEHEQASPEVEVLSYLGLTNDGDLRSALKQTIVQEQNGKLTVPYLLHLSKNSDVLPQALVAVFLEIYNENLLFTLKLQPKTWPAAYSLPNVMHLVVGLLLKIKKNSVQVILILANIAEKYSWCQELLELILTELEALTLDKRNCPLLEDAVRDSVRQTLWRNCTSEKPFVQQTAIRLILLASLRSHQMYYQSVVYLLSVDSNIGPSKHHINALVRLLGGSHGTPDAPKIKPALEIVFEQILLAPGKSTENLNVMRNLVEIVKLERATPQQVNLKKTNCAGLLQELMGKILKIWDKLLTQDGRVWQEGSAQGTDAQSAAKKIKQEVEPMEVDDDDDEIPAVHSHGRESEVIHVTVQLLEGMDISRHTVMNASETLKLSQLLVKYFFLCLQQSTMGDSYTMQNEESIHRIYSLLSKHCASRKAARAIALRELLEGALFIHGTLFGSQEQSDLPEVDKTDDSLIRQNQKQGIALNACRSTVLHAGVIGHGPKQPLKTAEGPGLEMQNRLLNAIVACCQDVNDQQATIDGFNYVSLLLVELVSPDVMYNGLPWPEEEFTKVTMERDLQIRRTFCQSPILWSILGLIACYRPSLCFSSVLLRALCASALHQWRARSVETQNGQKNELMYVTTKLLELMALGQLLPPPLSYLHIVVSYFDATEIAYILKECVWNYMKDHVPSPVLFVCDPTGFHWRDPLTSRPLPQYTNPLRNMMQKNITTVGHLYHQMFVGPELRNPTVCLAPNGSPPSNGGTLNDGISPVDVQLPQPAPINAPII